MNWLNYSLNIILEQLNTLFDDHKLLWLLQLRKFKRQMESNKNWTKSLQYLIFINTLKAYITKSVIKTVGARHYYSFVSLTWVIFFYFNCVYTFKFKHIPLYFFIKKLIFFMQKKGWSKIFSVSFSCDHVMLSFLINYMKFIIISK